MNFEHWILSWLPILTLNKLHHAGHGPDFVVPLAVSIQLIALYLAYNIYCKERFTSEIFIKRFGPIHTLILNKFYLDNIYLVFAERIVGGFSFALNKFDLGVVDGIVNGVGIVSMRISSRLRKIQTGLVQDYASVMLMGICALLILLKVGGGL
jgi:NADH-quinone oxidoreductase subunit L